MNHYWQSNGCTLYQGDALNTMRQLPAGTVRCCVTSPPYWGLRDYGADGQLGLEATPAEYVARMVEVFREVRRVLADDGTLWLNLGDSYATGAGKIGECPGGGEQGERWKNHHMPQTPDKKNANAGVPRTQPNRMPLPGLKPKDLCGIPWRVAFALQAPEYQGEIKRELDRIWLAAMIDAEGCIFIHKRKAGQSNGQGYERKSDSYGSGLEVANTSEAVVRRCMEIVGKGSICHQDGYGRKKRIFRWNLRSNECRNVLREVYPYLVAKQHEARLSIGCPSSGVDAEKAHASLIALHNGNEPCIDFKAPEPMFRPGWYLRQDVIWQKPNPMPESVRDRCTKAHEYIFLLAKAERYYWDETAMSEPATTGYNGSEFHTGKTGEHQLGRASKQPRFGGSKYGDSDDPKHATKSGNEYEPNGTRNRRSVWTVATHSYPEAHFATYPPKLIEPCILAGSAPGDTVLDPFTGSGTTGAVAAKHGRKFLGCELNPEYCALARRRIEPETQHLFAEEQP